MALVWGSGGAQVITSQNPSSVAVAYPTGTPTASRKYGYITYIGLRPDTAAITTPSGWTLLGTFSGGGGVPGGGTGPSEVSVFVRDDQTTATNSGSVTFTLTGSANMAWGYTERWECATTETIDWAITGGVDTTAATPFTFVTSSVATDFVKTGDGLIFAIVMAQGTAPTWQLATVTAQGGGTITLGTISQRVAPASTTGNDIGGRVSTAMPTVSSQQLAGTLTYSAGVTGTTTTTYGPGAIVRARALIQPAVTQAAYRFYADGTETGATALAAQDTAPTVDLSSADENLALRVRLQETAGGTVPATDDFQLQWEKNSSGTWVDVGTGTSTVSGYASANLTDGGATTSRLTGGTGTFGAGSVSEDGLVDNEGWTASGHTELLYALTLKQADFVNSDVLKFRVRRNGVNLDATTVTPTVNITIAPVTRQGTAALTATSTLTAAGTLIPSSARWVRDHTAGTSTVSGTTVAATTAAQVDAGNVLVAYYAGDNGGFQFPLVSSISKPGGETATWRRIITHDAGSSTANGWSRGELWAIKTTVNWPSSTAVTATIDSSRASKVLLLSEFTGCSVVLRNNPRGVSTTNPISGFDTFGQPTLAGDLVIGCTDFESNVVPSTYSNGTGGAWSSVYTANANTGTSSTSITAGMQWKVPTVDGHQVWDHSRTENGGTVLAVLAADFNAVPSPFVYHVSSPSPPATPSSATGTTLTAAGDVQAGDLTVLWMTTRPASSIPFPPDVGWVLIGSMAIGSDADGEGTGPVRLTAWCRQQNVGESAAPSIPVVTGGVTATFAGVYRKNDSNAIWQYPEVAFGASAAGSSFSATVDESLDAAPGEMIISVGGESNNTASVSSHDLIVPGCAMSEVVYFNGTNTTTGNNLTTWATQAMVVSGNQTSPATTLAQTSSGAASRGVMQIKVGATHTSPYVRTNLIENPSFETGSTGWTGGTRTSTLTNGAVPVGTYAYEATGATGSFVRDTTYGAIPVKQGRAYHFRNRVVGPATPTVKVDPVVPTTYAADGTTDTGPMERHTVTTFDTIGSFFANSWTSLVQYVPPPGAAYLGLPGGTDSDRLQFTFATNNATSQAVGIDSVIVEQIGNRAETYFDGDTTDTATWEYQWLGTAHASRARAISPAGATITAYAGANLTATSTLTATGDIGTGPTTHDATAALTATSTLTATGDVTSGPLTHDATAALTAASTLTATAVREPQSAAGLTATSTLTATAVRVQGAAAALTAASTLTATAVRAPAAAVSLLTASTLTATAVRTQNATAALTAASTLTATAVATEFATAALTATGTLATTPIRDQVAAANLAAASTLTATGVITEFATTALTSTTTLTATATAFHVPLGAAALLTTSTLTATTVRDAVSTAAMAAVSTLTATGTTIGVVPASAALTATSTLTTTGVREPQAAGTLTAATTLTATAVRVATVAAALTATSTLTATGVAFAVLPGAATLVGQSTLTATAERDAVTSAALTVASTLTTTGIRVPQAAADLTGVSMFTAIAVREQTTTAALSSTAVLTATGVRDATVLAALVASSTLAAAVSGVGASAANLVATSSLTSAAVREPIAAVSLTASSSLTATPQQTHTTTAALATTSTLTATGVREPQATAALTATSTLVAAGIQTNQATAALTTASTLTATGISIGVGLVAANLVTASTLTVAGVRTQPATTALTGASTLTATAVREPQSAVSLVSTSTLVATALRVVTPTVDLTTVSTLTATAERLRIVSRDLTTTSTLTAAGVVTTFATAALPSVSTLTATAIRTGVGVVEATLAATSTLTATAVRVKEAAADLAAVSTLTATAVRIPLSAANLTTASTLTATATRDAVASATLTAASTLTATGVRVPQATAALTATSTLTATGTVIGIGLVAATLATQSTLTATAVRTQLSTGALSASATLTATAVRAPQSAAALNASSTLTATGERIRPVAAGLITTSTLSATAIRFGVGVGTVDLTTTSTLTATATRTAVVAAALTTASTLQAGGGAIQPSTVTLTTTATLTPVGERVVLATVAMTATSTLDPAGLPTRIAAATLTVTSVLSTAPVRMLFPAAAFVQLSVLTANGQRVIIGINTVNNRPVLVKVPGVGWVPISRAGV